MKTFLLFLACALAPIVFPPAGLVAQTLGEAIGDDLYEALREKPDRFAEVAGEVIIGHGQGGRIDANGIEQMIAVRRAASRASHMRRLLLGDLDNDGHVTRAEIGVVLPTLSARTRARLVRLHRAADGDGNGVVTDAELRAHASDASYRDVTERAATEFRRVLLADLNRDGWVTLDEVQEILDQTRDQAG